MKLRGAFHIPTNVLIDIPELASFFAFNKRSEGCSCKFSNNIYESGIVEFRLA